MDDDLPIYERAVVTTYGRWWPHRLQWEVVEVCLFSIPGLTERLSVVVLDGNFCSVDVMPDGRYMLYDVEASVHHRNIGCEPEIPVSLASLIDEGEVTTLHSRWREIQARASRFVPVVKDASYEASMFTVRAVLPNADDTDARPWLIERRATVLYVLPGKLASCIAAADKVAELCRTSP